MSWLRFALLQLILFSLLAAVVYLHKDKVILLKNPPASLAQWYKPENKRQVWLHTMFSLRREAQAARYYVEQDNFVLAEQWFGEFTKHYLSLGEMVPEWSKKLDKTTLKNLEQSLQVKNRPDFLAGLEVIQQNCGACHQDYQAVTALIFRSPDFTSLELEPGRSLHQSMALFAEQVNQVKILATDGDPQAARVKLDQLGQSIDSLGTLCQNCHQNADIHYPDSAITQSLDQLRQSLQSGDLNQQNRHLGTLAVVACAECHATHKLGFDASQKLKRPDSWSQAIRH